MPKWDQLGRRPFPALESESSCADSPRSLFPPKSACVVAVRERFRGVLALMLGELRRAAHVKAARLAPAPSPVRARSKSPPTPQARQAQSKSAARAASMCRPTCM
jgi:hypothetical protein